MLEAHQPNWGSNYAQHPSLKLGGGEEDTTGWAMPSPMASSADSGAPVLCGLALQFGDRSPIGCA